MLSRQGADQKLWVRTNLYAAEDRVRTNERPVTRLLLRRRHASRSGFAVRPSPSLRPSARHMDKRLLFLRRFSRREPSEDIVRQIAGIRRQWSFSAPLVQAGAP